MNKSENGLLTKEGFGVTLPPLGNLQNAGENESGVKRKGMRQGEILNLKWDDVDLQNGMIYIKNSKSGKLREIPIHPELLDYLGSANRVGPYVFADENGMPYSRYGKLRHEFENALKRAGIRNFRFHDLRHTFASELAMRGVDLRTIQDYLGHSTLRMTERYAHLLPNHKKFSIQLLSRENCYNSATVEKQESYSAISNLQEPVGK